MADEVGNEGSDRHLSAKPVPFGLPRSQYLPEPLFGFGHVTTEGPGALARTVARRFLHHESVLGITPSRSLPHRGGGCAFSRIASKIGTGSPGAVLFTCNTSAVAVCCSNASRNSSRSRRFSASRWAKSSGVAFRPPPRWGRDREGVPSWIRVGVTGWRFLVIAARTPSAFSSTSLFQNRSTRYPSPSRNRVRLASAPDKGSCCPPSISIISLA